MNRFFRTLGKLLALAGALCVIIYVIHDYTKREYWVYITQDPPVVPDVILTLDRTVYDKKHFIISYALSNHTKGKMTWGEELSERIEQWTEDGWRYRAHRMRKNAAFPAVGYYLETGASMRGEISLYTALPRLTPGRYRYVRYFGSLEDRCMVFQEFTIE